jgi:putative transposase
MRAESLLCQLERRFVPTTDSRHGLQTYLNLLVALALTAPHQAWVADEAYLKEYRPFA